MATLTKCLFSRFRGHCAIHQPSQPHPLQSCRPPRVADEELPPLGCLSAQPAKVGGHSHLLEVSKHESAQPAKVGGHSHSGVNIASAPAYLIHLRLGEGGGGGRLGRELNLCALCNILVAEIID